MPHRLSFLQPHGRRAALRYWATVLLWPLLGVFLVALLWLNTFSQIRKAQDKAIADIRAQAISTVNSYSQQLGQTVDQINQITLRLKYHWEDPDMPVNLEKDREHGLFPENQLLYANIFNAKGDLITSSVSNPSRVNAADKPYFIFHQQHCCGGLLISPPSPGFHFGRPIVRFSRRLNSPDGSFNGVAIVSVEPPYLTSFQENALPGASDFVSVRLTSGPLLATKVAAAKNDPPIFYKEPPRFDSAAGIRLEPAEKFRDGHARYVAWQKLPNVPMVALAGFSIQDPYAVSGRQAEEHRQTAFIQTILLGAFIFAATYSAVSYARRKRLNMETQETYRIATDAANEGFYMIRPIYDRHGFPEDFRLDDCNNRAAELIGTTREKLAGKRSAVLMPERFRQDMLNLCRLALARGFIEEEVRVAPYSPLRARWVHRRIVRSGAGLALTIRDISEAKEHEAALTSLANNDALTGLPNRHWMTQFLPAAIDGAVKRSGRLAILFIDLDNFKNVNDTLGHDAGDELLCQAALRLKNAVRASDHVARLGGDEFVVVLEHIDVVDDVARAAAAVIAAIGKPFALAAGLGNEVNASIGISLYPEDGKDAETLLKHADIAMYAAKAAGKGRYAFYHSHLSDTLVLRLSKERALREAVENNEFIVHYQPRVGIHSGRLTSMEALVRWKRPEHGIVYPAEFIDIAEDIGLIVRLGELVIDSVCRQLAQWRAQGLLLVPVSVNVSPQQLKSGGLSRYLADCIQRHGIDTTCIEVELTESAVIDRSQVVSAELAAIRAMGIKLMIDDFGTGYSSMAQLHRLDVDVLKVDKAFTKALSDGEEGKLLFGAIMSMANALDICVVAEGVETSEELTVLKALACDEIQGYFISKAVSAAEMGKLMLKRFLLDPPPGHGRLASV